MIARYCSMQKVYLKYALKKIKSFNTKVILSLDHECFCDLTLFSFTKSSILLFKLQNYQNLSLT